MNELLIPNTTVSVLPKRRYRPSAPSWAKIPPREQTPDKSGNARADYFDARYNLGNPLASLGDCRGALAQFQAAVRINPEDANAEANLGSTSAVRIRMAN